MLNDHMILEHTLIELLCNQTFMNC
uniref:Uncharacterized protein n=1 Tax=Arundo donax TaxID=35708 RepID=A0A0A9BAT9_ARUDO